MHSLDEPLDLKLSISKLRAAREKRERALSVVRPRALHRELGLLDDSPKPGSPGSPPSGSAPTGGSGLPQRSYGGEAWCQVPRTDGSSAACLLRQHCS